MGSIGMGKTPKKKGMNFPSLGFKWDPLGCFLYLVQLMWGWENEFRFMVGRLDYGQIDISVSLSTCLGEPSMSPCRTPCNPPTPFSPTPDCGGPDSRAPPPASSLLDSPHRPPPARQSWPTVRRLSPPPAAFHSGTGAERSQIFCSENFREMFVFSYRKQLRKSPSRMEMNEKCNPYWKIPLIVSFISNT